MLAGSRRFPWRELDGTQGNEVVVTRHGKPIARVVPVTKGSPENLLLEIGMVLSEGGVSKEEALRALQAAQKAVHG